MYDFIVTIFFLVTTCEIRASSKTESELSRLLAVCLKKEGTSSDVFVGRDDLSNHNRYIDLNYQANTRIPDVHPLAILVVNNAADVSNAIRCVRKLKIPVAIKSGGHSYEKYSFGNDKVVVIDLQNMDQISVDKKSKTATVGSGVLLAHLYWAIWNEGKFGIPGGSCVGVGVGLTLGGGFGYLSKIYGLTLDNLLEIEIVNAEGDILISNKVENKDLFWAVRGAGGGNLGVVTKLKYKLFDASNVKFTQIQFTYDISDFNKVFKIWDSWNAANQKNTAFAGLDIISTKISVRIVDADLNRDAVEEIKKHFPSAATTSVQTYNFVDFVIDTSEVPHVTNSSQLKATNRKDRPKRSFRAKSYFSSRTATDHEIVQLGEVLRRIPAQVFVNYDSFGGAINRVKSNATAFVHRDSLYDVQVGISTNDYNVAKWVDEYNEVVIATLDNGESYQNYIDGELENFWIGTTVKILTNWSG